MGVMKCHEATQFGANINFRVFFFPMEESDQNFYFTEKLKFVFSLYGCYLKLKWTNLLLFFQFLIFRNGHFLGVAFDNVQYGPGLAYFPAASLSYGESCHMNFGSAPFKYPFDKQRKKTKQNK